MESQQDLTKKKKKKERTAGIIYLSTIPPFMTVKKIQEVFSRYGEVDHVFLQPANKGPAKARKRFTEGWVEFVDKKVAKSVAAFLNNRIVGGKRRSKWHDCLWNIKFLHRFKWTHLNERLAYEKAVHDQRMRVEIAQAKRETNFYINAVEMSKKNKQLQKRNGSIPQVQIDIRQKPTEEEFQNKKQQLNRTQDDDSVGNKGILHSIFGGNT